MLKLNKLRLLYCFTFISFFQNSFSMCFRRAVKPLSDIVRLRNKRIFTNHLQRTTKKFNYSKSGFYKLRIPKSYFPFASFEPIDFEKLPSYWSFVGATFNAKRDVEDFEKLLNLYKQSKSNESSNRTRRHCLITIKDFSKEEMFLYSHLNFQNELKSLFRVLVELIGESIKIGDNEFADILINWALDLDKIKIAIEYIKNEKIDDLIELVKDSLFTDLSQWCHDKS